MATAQLTSPLVGDAKTGAVLVKIGARRFHKRDERASDDSNINAAKGT